VKTRGGLEPISLADAMAAAGQTAQNSYFEQWLGGSILQGMARSSTDTIRFLTLEDLARLFAVVRASPRNRALFLIAYRQGCVPARSGYCGPTTLISGALRIMVHRLKGSHSGAHPMQPDEAKALQAYLRGHRFVPPRADWASSRAAAIGSSRNILAVLRAPASTNGYNREIQCPAQC
jgi:hypothetical protein